MYLAWKLKHLAWPTHRRLDGHMVPSVKYLVGFRIGPNSVNEPVRGTFCQDNGNGSIFNFGPRRKCEPQTCSPILSCLGMWWNSWDETGKADQQLHSTEAALLPALATVDTGAHSRALRANQRHIQSSDQGLQGHLGDWMITRRKGQQRHRKSEREKLVAREALGGVWLYWECKPSFSFLFLTVTYGGAWVIRCGSKGLYPLSHLIRPTIATFFWQNPQGSQSPNS